MVLDDNGAKIEIDPYERISEIKPDWKRETIESRLESFKPLMPKIEKTREILNKLKNAEMNPEANPQMLDALRRSLNNVYDDLLEGGSFRTISGKISQKFELLEILDDTSFELFALEKNPLIKENSKGKKVIVGSDKSDIFFKRMVEPYIPPVSASNIREAVQISKAENNNINFERVGELLQKDVKEIERELLQSGEIYKNHKGENIEKDEFLSGNIREKIASFYDEVGNLKLSDDETIRAYQQKSLNDLRSVIPNDIEVPHIHIPFGAHWLDLDIFKDFLSKELDINGENLKYVGNSWTGRLDGAFMEITTSKQFESDTGIKAINGVNYFLKMMNNETLEVKTSKKVNNKNKTFKDPIATQKLQELKTRLEKKLKNFIMDNDEYADRVKRKYNDIFNSTVERKYDGAHLELIGSNKDIKLRTHQKNAAYRFLQKARTMLAHDVGTGKTYTMIASAMLSKQLGLAKKSLIVTPNNVAAQMATEARKFYPNAKIKLIQGLSRNEKNRLMASVKNNDYDLVIASYESFKNMNSHPSVFKEYKENEMAELRSIIADLESQSDDNRLMKSMANRLESMKNKLDEFLSKVENNNQNVFFEDLNIDNLIFDEAHYLKNLPIFTKQVNVRGIGKANSQRALDAFLKIRHHQKINKKVMFATGTPITNYVSDIYVMQKYLDFEGLEKAGVDSFDRWSAQFAQAQTQFELKASGNYESTTRLRNFTNLPELKKMYYEFTDLVSKDDVKAAALANGDKLNEPEPEYINVVCKPSKAQEALMQSIKKRSDDLKKDPLKALEKGGDNHLKILSDANKGSLDMRILDPSLERDSEGKISKCAQNILEQYHAFDKDKGTQLIFLDSSTPKIKLSPAKRQKIENRLNSINERLQKHDEGDIDLDSEVLEKLENEKMELEETLEMAKDGFSAYEDLKQLLIEKGIKPDEIAFVHDYTAKKGPFSRDELSIKVNEGKIRVLIGSTAKMGAGNNYQKRLVAVHHLDLDWTPANMEQREGRILRIGNELAKLYSDAFKAKIYYYVTEKMSDTLMLQTLNQKRKIIKQITNPHEKARFIEDTSEDDFMAKLQAITSPYAEQELRFMGLDKEIELLTSELEEQEYIKKSALKNIDKQEGIINSLKQNLEKLPQILNRAKNNEGFKTAGGEAIDTKEKAVPKLNIKSGVEKLNHYFTNALNAFHNSSEKLSLLGEYRGNKLFAFKAGNDIVVKIGDDFTNALDFLTLTKYESSIAFNANARLKNAFERIEKKEFKDTLMLELENAKIEKERAIKKYTNAKEADLSQTTKMLNDAILERAELGVFLGKAK